MWLGLRGGGWGGLLMLVSLEGQRGGEGGSGRKHGRPRGRRYIFELFTVVAAGKRVFGVNST